MPKTHIMIRKPQVIIIQPPVLSLRICLSTRNANLRFSASVSLVMLNASQAIVVYGLYDKGHSSDQQADWNGDKRPTPKAPQSFPNSCYSIPPDVTLATCHLETSISPFEVSEDKFDCFDAWWARYRTTIEVDLKEMDDPAEVRLILRKLGQKETTVGWRYKATQIRTSSKTVSASDFLARINEMGTRCQIDKITAKDLKLMWFVSALQDPK
ncbi:hypothetical protein Ciccas_010724, partial [Cichlidogyrus casuarinus]